MKGLTEKQQAIWDMKRPVDEGGQGKTRDEIAALLGISRNVVSKTITVIHKKLGLDGKERGDAARLTETTHPEKAAALIDAATDPFAKIEDAMLAAGLPASAAAAVLKRMRTRYLNATTEIRNLKTAEVLDMLGKKIHLALSYMDDKVMAEASFRDLALGTTAMIEKRQLLRGEPTQIISDTDRKKMHELTPMLIAEAQRRGITLEGQVIEKTVHAEPANAPA